MLLFLTGWPACGAAFYGEWLARRFDYIHLDVDDNPTGETELIAMWEKLVPARGAAFGARLRKKHPRWVVTGRAPTDNLPRLEGLQSAGFSLWFLLARTESISRQRWMMLERETDPEVRPVAWEKQADAIRSSARSLRPFFRDHCVETLNAGLELMDGDELATRIGATGK